MVEESENEERINIMTLGNTEVGKTSFILRFTENQYQDSYLATVGVDFKLKSVTIKEKQYNLFFYDTTGQERYKSLSVNLIKSAHGIIIMYDITSKQSFNSVYDWIQNVKNVKGENFPMILVGNKKDKEEERLIAKEEGENIAKEYKIDFFEISNKQNINVQEAGLAITNKVIEKREKEGSEGSSPAYTTSSKLSKKSAQKNVKKSCC